MKHLYSDSLTKKDFCYKEVEQKFSMKNFDSLLMWYNILC